MFAVRDRPELLAGLPELVIDRLSDDDARDLLDSVMLGGIDPRVRDRIIAETRGMPLAILEVPHSISAAELAGGFWISGKRSSPAAVEADLCPPHPVPARADTAVAARSRRPNRSAMPRCSLPPRHDRASRSMRWRPRKKQG